MVSLKVKHLILRFPQLDDRMETTWKTHVSERKHEGNHKDIQVFQCKYKRNHMKLRENLATQDILIHQKASNFVNSLFLTNATSNNKWDKMA